LKWATAAAAILAARKNDGADKTITLAPGTSPANTSRPRLITHRRGLRTGRR
jgi:hypothetical protein